MNAVECATNLHVLCTAGASTADGEEPLLRAASFGLQVLLRGDSQHEHSASCAQRDSVNPQHDYAIYTVLCRCKPGRCMGRARCCAAKRFDLLVW